MKKILSLMMAAALAVSLLTACGGTGSSSASTGGETTSGDSSAATSEGGDEAENTSSLGLSDTGYPLISFMVPSYFGGELVDTREGFPEIRAAYEDYTGISVAWQPMASDAYEDTFGLTLMDRANMPMVLAGTGSITGTVIQAAQQGAFWDLTPFLESGEYPYLEQAPEDVYANLTVNGQIIGIPKLRNTGRYGLSYRTDWAEAVGVTEVPETPEEVYDLLYKFTHDDPDGNGQDDTYGLEAVGEYTGWMDVIMTWFGCGYKWVEQDGDLVPVHETEEYKAAVDWLKKCYDEGIMRSDFITVPTSEWGSKVQSGEAGAIVDTLDSAGRRAWLYFQQNDVMSVVNPDEYASMTLVGPVNGHTAAVQVYNGYFLITKDGAKTEQDVKNCLKFLDMMNSVEMRALAEFGIEGMTYEIDESGAAVMHEDLEQASYPQQGLNQAVAYIPFNLEGAIGNANTEPYVTCLEVMERTAEYAVFNPAEAYLNMSETYILNGTILDQTINDARTQYITGAIDWDGFQAAVQTWENQGGAAVKEEVNAQYHAE